MGELVAGSGEGLYQTKLADGSRLDRRVHVDRFERFIDPGVVRLVNEVNQETRFWVAVLRNPMLFS